MELKDVTADMGEAPVEEIVEESQPSESQADEVEDSFEETEEEAETADSEEPAEEQDTSKGEPSEEDVPFFEKPGVKERIEGVKSKYESKANSWDTIVEISRNDPEFGLVLAERLERAGKLPVGTTQRMRTEIEQQKATVESSEQYIENLPPDVRADLLAAREFRQQQELAKAQQEKQAEEYFAKFEENKPDIASSPNPSRTRAVIFNMASELMDRGESDFAKAMEQAYKLVLHQDKIAQSAKEDGQIEAMVQANQEAASGLASGSAPMKSVKLTQEERRAAEMIGMTPEEYRKYKDTDSDELFESI